ncbi:hypothetical protein CN487_25290, partial [Bacillus cereus]
DHAQDPGGQSGAQGTRGLHFRTSRRRRVAPAGTIHDLEGVDAVTVNVVVPGLSDRQRAELEALPGADQMRFHSLLDVETLTAAPHFDLESLL